MSTSRSFDAHHEILVSDFYRHLPEDIHKDNKNAIGQYVADQLSRSEAIQFSSNGKPYTFNKETPRGRPSVFANAEKFRYTCSQKQRILKTSTLPYGKTRNRRARVELYNCNGTATVIFPAASSNAPFDFSVEIDHNSHPGREQFGLPLVVREWILQNPRPTSIIQREELMRAIERGELPNVQGVYLKPMQIHYWWRKATKDLLYPTKDSWENVYHTLQKDPMVRNSNRQPKVSDNRQQTSLT
jgi:hypothetical protein